MASASVLRFWLPLGNALPIRQRHCWRMNNAAHPTTLQSRNASTVTGPSKPRVLEKPAKFYPPSHPQRLVKRTIPRQHPGPPISHAQKEEQRTRKYPHMMPAEGTFMYWFLNNRMLHMCITLVYTTLSNGNLGPTLSNLLSRVFSSHLPLPYPWRISIEAPHSSTCCLQPENSGLILSGSLPPTERSINSIQTMLVLKQPKGGRGRSTTCKNAAAIAKHTAWKRNRDLAGGLQRLMQNCWALQCLQGICQTTRVCLQAKIIRLLVLRIEQTRPRSQKRMIRRAI